ncbi:gluconeogenesis factor YvcK family protein [Apilactobacillus xinyiensis]|uniref:gluconeogenesis factor YvcK family protein n=1 Tax=Apilactobacillus xinyiensis TaxID=2841032 RepID=UPI00200C803C|nr:uridine diphosphate-N-acetylglucosamine-binding protein YvcK [Apilactobacillus xinyiensis]MCL0330275.1 uridine diphosphate-N-acetylglucosamine-binding protein YvcK [Apilactobacillus xinyiensis]
MKSPLESMPKVVVIGGGTGLPVILDKLKNEPVDITAVVTVADDGGSSGKLRECAGAVPPGDIRNVLVALSKLPKAQLDIFQHRFSSSDGFLAGHPLGNLIITAISEKYGGISEAVATLSTLMHIKGHVFPASNDTLTLSASFTDGTRVSGESEITHANKLIKNLHLSVKNSDKIPMANSNVIDAILNADQILLGPGSVFTSILPNLMIPNLKAAVLKSRAKVVYICNIMTQKGETDGLTDAEHVKILNEYLGAQVIDVVLVNQTEVPDMYIDKKKWDEISQPVEHDAKGLELQNCDCILDNFLKLENSGAFHDGEKVTQKLMHILGQEGK